MLNFGVVTLKFLVENNLYRNAMNWGVGGLCKWVDRGEGYIPICFIEMLGGGFKYTMVKVDGATPKRWLSKGS